MMSFFLKKRLKYSERHKKNREIRVNLGGQFKWVEVIEDIKADPPDDDDSNSLSSIIHQTAAL